ncbi:unnamed protein product [Peniophora sp. CBMAI 1063]|nr:unnamed protein product [Peniophora sp. CBMAI 1063]
MGEPAPQAPSMAQAPFSDVDADIVLRSSDNIDFRLHKTILTRAFHGFDDLLSGLATAAAYQTGTSDAMDSSDEHGRPILVLTERADVLDALFRLFYYVDSPTLSDFKVLRAVCLCLDRYCVKTVPYIIHELLIKALNVPAHQRGTTPGTVYALACRLQLDDIALLAARASLPNSEILRELQIDDVQLISSAQYHALNVYFNDCREAAARVVADPLVLIPAVELPCSSSHSTDKLLEYLQNPGAFGQFHPIRSGECECGMTETLAGTRKDLAGQLPAEPVVIPEWLCDYLEACNDELYRKPDAENVTRPKFYVKYLREAMACPFCARSIDSFLSFLPRLKEIIDEEVGKVQLIATS